MSRPNENYELDFSKYFSRKILEILQGNCFSGVGQWMKRSSRKRTPERNMLGVQSNIENDCFLLNNFQVQLSSFNFKTFCFSKQRKQGKNINNSHFSSLPDDERGRRVRAG